MDTLTGWKRSATSNTRGLAMSNNIHERLLKSDVKYRFSIDRASLKSA